MQPKGLANIFSFSRLVICVGSSWEITAYFHALPSESTEEAQLWIPTDTKQWMQPPQITPIKSMSSDPLRVQLYLEHPSPLESMAPAE